LGVLDGFREILGSSERPWVLQADFTRRYQIPGESLNDFQQAIGLFGRKAFPKLDAKAQNTWVLERIVAGIRGPQIRKVLLRDWPSTPEKALALAREEEVLQAACEQPPWSLFSVPAVRPHSSHDASTQTPWQPCSCGSSSRQNNWNRPLTRRPNKPQASRTI
uniref:SCAN box domain-containing protein n=1 Tax=Schistocephalus solidus TaxID=70667 RepID=A0A183TR32_SCHSO